MSASDPLHEIAPGDRWLVVVAHPDDETFGCGSVIAHAASRGAAVTVVCATRGEEGERSAAVPADADLGDVREAELRAAAGLLGASSVALLGHRDSGFDGALPAGALCSVPERDLASEIAGFLHPAVRVLVTIDGSDGHRDHVHVRRAMHRAVGRLPLAERPERYEVGLPNGLMRRWAAEMAALEPDSPYLALDLATLGTPEASFTDVLDTPELLERREAAIATHRSQASPFDRLSPELRRAFLASTCLVRVPRAVDTDPRAA